jgi:hypothetical protein
VLKAEQQLEEEDVAIEEAEGEYDSSRTQRSLEDAQTLKGECYDMCPEPERTQRQSEVRGVSRYEKLHAHFTDLQQTMIKDFKKSAADYSLNIPELVRPPGVLYKTLCYIEEHIMEMDRVCAPGDMRFRKTAEDNFGGTPDGKPKSTDAYNFIWFRTRMIRKDFMLQNFRGAGRNHPIATECHERIARWHIMMGHQLQDDENFVIQQNTEQLGQTLKSLNEFYDAAADRNDPTMCSTNEAEFRCYFILSNLLKPTEWFPDFLTDRRQEVLNAPEISFALSVSAALNAKKTVDFHSFFRFMRKASYLQACLMTQYLPYVRERALVALNYTIRNPVPLAKLQKWLQFDSPEQTLHFCAKYERELQGNTMVVLDRKKKVGKGGVAVPKEWTPYPERGEDPSRYDFAVKMVPLVEAKAAGLTRLQVCRGQAGGNAPPPESPRIAEILEQEASARTPRGGVALGGGAGWSSGGASFAKNQALKVVKRPPVKKPTVKKEVAKPAVKLPLGMDPKDAAEYLKSIGAQSNAFVGGSGGGGSGGGTPAFIDGSAGGMASSLSSTRKRGSTGGAMAVEGADKKFKMADQGKASSKIAWGAPPGTTSAPVPAPAPKPKTMPKPAPAPAPAAVTSVAAETAVEPAAWEAWEEEPSAWGGAGAAAGKQAVRDCKFGYDCTRPDCWFTHPSGRMLDGD